MPAAQPVGEAAPVDGRLPEHAVADLDDRPFGVYAHVPYCASRCGYCDFNTYTPSELGADGPMGEYVASAVAEVRLAAAVLGDARPPASTVFFGGGTPTLLPAKDLAAILGAVRGEFGLTPDAEVTVEANPESVDQRGLEELRAAGFNRVSLGMQSAREHVLRALDRRHTPGRAASAVRQARAAGFEHVNLDLIYGAPGESDADWLASLDAVLAADVDHVSAYALIVEDGTRLASRVRAGELPAPDDDVLADRYLAAERTLAAAGFGWYEVSNWAASPAARCRHNELYWTGAHWWGVGPGAHSHVGGVRWWNVKHPTAYADRLRRGESPAKAREVLTADERRIERVLLELRLVAGCPAEVLTSVGREAAAVAVADGLLDAAAWRAGRAVLTLRGRLLADAVVRALVD